MMWVLLLTLELFALNLAAMWCLGRCCVYFRDREKRQWQKKMEEA